MHLVNVPNFIITVQLEIYYPNVNNLSFESLITVLEMLINVHKTPQELISTS